MGLRLIAAPTVEPVSVAEAKADLRIDHTDDDAKIARHITAARDWLERRIQRKVAEQTWEFVIDEFPSAEIKLPFGYVQEIVSIKYDGTDGLEATVNPVDYYLDNVSVDNWVFPVESWPATLDAVNAVRIQFLAGYATADDVPPALRQAIRLKVQELYDGTDQSRAIGDLSINHFVMHA